MLTIEDYTVIIPNLGQNLNWVFITFGLTLFLTWKFLFSLLVKIGKTVLVCLVLFALFHHGSHELRDIGGGITESATAQALKDQVFALAQELSSYEFHYEFRKTEE